MKFRNAIFISVFCSEEFCNWWCSFAPNVAEYFCHLASLIQLQWIMDADCTTFTFTFTITLMF